ncbi:sulfite exporter TauE/SafE family protein [Oceanospirillum sp.]|uniref:sulfite exporter TauE/SafE family protein n=1 Tax=Oceanospirillum sp. TaxID=2021254 RepID=UPI003A8DEFF9
MVDLQAFWTEPLTEGLSNLHLFWLVLTSALTSFITAAMGIGGGVLLLAVMATLLPPLALIPVHGLVQFGSNANRALMTRRHIHWPMVLRFSLGAVLGALIASQVLVQLPVDWIQRAVAFFILYMVWGPKPKKLTVSGAKTVFAGGLTTLISMFVGATGPLVAAFVHRLDQDKLSTTATFSACMSFQHVTKAAVFGALGFHFSAWFVPIVLMIAAGAFGTWLGLKLLNRIPGHLFRRGFALIVTLLALRLLWQSFMA